MEQSQTAEDKLCALCKNASDAIDEAHTMAHLDQFVDDDLTTAKNIAHEILTAVHNYCKDRRITKAVVLLGLAHALAAHYVSVKAVQTAKSLRPTLRDLFRRLGIELPHAGSDN